MSISFTQSAKASDYSNAYEYDENGKPIEFHKQEEKETVPKP